MTKFALVGNIASGKSTVEKILTEEYNCPVLDTDKVCHELLVKLPEIPTAFKDFDILEENGQISREKLGKLVFNDNSLKTKLEQILYPHVRVEINKFFAKNNDKKAFVAIPLLFEANMQDLFDKIIFVYCEDEIRLNRLIARNNYDIKYAQKRIDAQMSQQEKIIRSDFVIYNNSSIENLRSEINKTLKNL